MQAVWKALLSVADNRKLVALAGAALDRRCLSPSHVGQAGRVQHAEPVGYRVIAGQRFSREFGKGRVRVVDQADRLASDRQNFTTLKPGNGFLD